MALDIKNGLGLMRLNKTIKQIIFDDINQIKIDTSEVEKIALDIKDGLGVKINSQNKMKEFICDFLISCANEKSPTKISLHEHRTRRGSVAGKVMISGLSSILGINEDEIYKSACSQRIESMMELMDNICIDFNELISIDKEANSENASLPWSTTGEYEKWKNQLRKLSFKRFELL